MACMNRAVLSIIAPLLAATTVPANAQLHEKHEAKVAEFSQVQNVKGGTTFQVMVPYEKTFGNALNYLKRQGYTIDTASAETGQIVTAMEVKGSYRQTGTRMLVICIKDDDAKTSVRVVVTEQKRTKLLQTEPWGDAKANEAESMKLAEQIKGAVGI
jgi:hypothetical protein